MSPRNLTAVTTSLQLYFRGSWERGLVALILPAKPRKQKFPLAPPRSQGGSARKGQGGGKRSPVELRGMGREPGTWC